MGDLKLTPTLVAMLERIEQHSGALLMLAVTASGGGEYGKLNKLRGAGYVVKCDHPSVTEGAWPAEALAITEEGRTALAKHRAETIEKKGQRRPGDKRVIFRRDGERYIVFLGDDRIGFVQRTDNGNWNRLMSEKSKRNLVKPRSRPFRSGWSPPSAGLSGSRGFSRAAIRACRRLRPEVGREGDHGVARSGRVRASLASVPRSALADAFGPRSAARLSATSGLGRWFLPRARTRVSDGKLAFAPVSSAIRGG